MKYRSIYSSDWDDYDDYDDYTGYSEKEAITTSKWDDWYGRSSFGGGKKKHTSKLGWDKKVTYGGSYSSYFLGNYGPKSVGNLDAIKKCYSQAKDLITILDLPFKVSIQISEGSSSFSDGRRICVATDMFDDKDMDDGEKLDVFCGVTVHEGAHLMFTKFNCLQQLRDEVNSDVDYNVIKHILNIIEDERIEDQLSAARPGLSGFLEKSKYYYFDKHYKEDISKVVSEGMKSSDVLNFIDLMFKVIRYPKYIKPEIVEKYSSQLEKLKNWIVPLPDSTEQVLKVSIEIYEFLVKEFGRDDITEAFNTCRRSLEEISPTPMYGADEDGQFGIDTSKVSREIHDSSFYAIGALEGTIDTGLSSKSYFIKERGEDGSSKTIYQKHLDNIKRYVPAIRKLVQNTDKNYDFIIKSCRHGILDTNKLVEAYQGVPQVYQRKGTVTTNSTTICLLVDESGSMYGMKESLARDAVILLNEAFGKLKGVDLYIYGHTADEEGYERGSYCQDTDITIYREGTNFTPRYSLGNITAKNENRDGVAILETAHRVRKFTQQPVIMFVISDGEPSANDYRDEPAIRDTGDKVKQVEKMGFEVIQITIDECPKAQRMFSKYIDLSGDISNMPIMLAKIIKKCVIKDKVTKIL